MKFNDIKPYIVDQLNHRMKLNLDERDVYSDYIDELHYRLMIHIPDAIDKDGSSGIIIDLEKGDFLDNIIIWGLEVELGLICKENIEEIFTFLEEHFNSTSFYQMFDQYDQNFRSGWEPSETMLNFKTITDWVNNYQVEMMDTNEKSNDVSYIHKVMIKHTYYGEVKTYALDEQGMFRLVE